MALVDEQGLVHNEEINSVEAEKEDVEVAAAEVGTSWLLSALIVVNAALGAGILNFPAAFNQAGGIGVAMTAQVVLVAFAALSMMILGWCSELKGDVSYQGAIGTFCGVWGSRASSVCILVYMYGTCITFLVIAGDQSDSIFKALHGEGFETLWYMNRKFTVAVSALLLILPFCFVRRIDYLKYPSLVASVSILYLVVLSVIVFHDTDRSDVVVRTSPTVWTDVFLVFPAICFAYQCHVSVIPVYASLSPHNLKNFGKTTASALSVCFISYSSVGILGYLTYGINIQPDIFSSFSPNNAFVLVGFVGFAIKNYMTYPILVFCGRLALETLLNNVITLRAGRKFRIVSGVIWFATSLAIAVVLPNIRDAIDYLGCLGAIFIFIFPGICLWNAIEMFDETLKLWQKRCGRFLAGTYMVVGALLFGMTLTQGIQQSDQ